MCEDEWAFRDLQTVSVNEMIYGEFGPLSLIWRNRFEEQSQNKIGTSTANNISETICHFFSQRAKCVIELRT